MQERQAGRGKTSILVIGLLLVLALQVFPSLTLKTPTFDEPAHIGAGLSYWKTGDFKVNLQHPPLLKEIAALPLLGLGVEWPIADRIWDELTAESISQMHWQVGQDVIYANGPERVMFWARLPFLGLALLLGYLIYAWGRKLVGEPAAVAAVFFYVLDPNIVAHAPLVVTDIGFATFGFLFLFTLWRYLDGRSLVRLILCGLALGAALGAKFTGLLLLPVAAILILWANRWIPAAAPPRPSTLMDPYASPDRGQRLSWCVYMLIAMTVVAALVIHALYFLPRDSLIYIEGIQRINADHDPSNLYYMAGHLRPHFWTYYLVAYLLKEPVALIILTCIGLWTVLRKGFTSTKVRAFLLLPPLVLFLTHSLWSHDLGFRYLIPALPFLYLIAGAGLKALLDNRRAWAKPAAVLLCAWLVVAAAGIYPDHLSYFNETACLYEDPRRIGLDGGSSCGPLWLADSNVDWGQGLNQLRAWLDDYAPDTRISLGYLGTVRPERYGLTFDRVFVKDLERPPVTGLYALSAHLVAHGIGVLGRQHGDGPGNWLLHTPPTAIVGHAYYIYDLRRPATR